MTQQLTTIQHTKAPALVRDMQYQPTIRELMQQPDQVNPVKGTIAVIAAKYLSLNIKGKSLTQAAAFDIMVEHIISECSNLEMQEIDYIFRSGVLGKFGTIYNDISLDTICGADGWIETYYRDHRKMRPEPIKHYECTVPGAADMTESEFYDRNPDYRKYVTIRDIIRRAIDGRITMTDVSEIYAAYGYAQEDLQQDIDIHHYNYGLLPTEYKEVVSIDQYTINEFRLSVSKIKINWFDSKNPG